MNNRLDPNGTGTVELNANTNVTGNLTATGNTQQQEIFCKRKYRTRKYSR